MSSVIDGVGVEGVHKILDSHESIPLHSSQPAIIDSRVEEGENVMENVTVGRDETPTAQQGAQGLKTSIMVLRT